jgi:outer membrane protein OmpA-like peptidoglycan-associated protein
MAVCIAGGPALAANQASKQETIGVGMGATVGALAGGPVGFILGAAIGAKIGDEFHRKDVQVVQLDNSLKSSRSRIVELEMNVDSLNAGIDGLNSDLTRLRESSRPELLSLLQAGIEMDLLFRTDEYELPDSTREKLAELSASLAAMPDVHVHVDGFADERGDSAYNQVLSVQRADFVRQILEENGIAAERIGLTAHGESPAADGTADSYALERRVSLTLFVEDPQSLAANPD